MLMQMYVIFDKKAKIYNKPFYLINDNVALRTANQLVNDVNMECSKSPEDFVMFRIGSYEDTTAKVKPYEKHDVICRFHELVQHHKPFDPIETGLTGDEKYTEEQFQEMKAKLKEA